jgi:CheY-like chemotaxis protein
MTPFILLIDDDEAAHIYHNAMMEMANYDMEKIVNSYSVDEAIGLLSGCEAKKHFCPKYIFMDLNMPKKSGYDFIDEFTNLDLKFRPDIYIVSSSKNPSDLKRIQNLSYVKGFESKFLTLEFFKDLKSNHVV